ncbi:MAG: c-type cytochrome [Candidatus Rokubacteria bacterium]|nr:c-type cytochrome [Candidatus Rokubacteria bacterium]
MSAFLAGADVWRPRVRLALGLLVLGLSVASAAEKPATAPADPRRSEAVYRRYCAVCHGPEGKGDGPNAPFLEDDQPRDLTDSRYIGGLSDEHLYRVIAEGGQAIRGSRFMPPWRWTLSPSQIREMVTFIRALSAGAPASPSLAAEPPAGATLAVELGCPVCHRIGDLELMPVGPNLSADGDRVQRAWLVQFLKTPHTIRSFGYHPLSRSRMPDFRLSDEEAVSLADYLITRQRGIPEPSPESPRAAALVQRGRELFRQYACRACHTRDGTGGRAGPDLDTVAQRLKPGWVMRFIRDPQAVDCVSPMPHLGVGEDGARAITHYLFDAAFPQPDSPPSAEAARKGFTLYRALGCGGCHWDESNEVTDRIGPDLSGAGDRLRSEWVSGFLTQSTAIRLWLTARMPGFRLTEAEVRALADFIANLKDPATPPLPERLRFSGSISEANVQAGRRLASREFLSCSSCHLGEEQPEGSPEEWAPDLRISAQRLKPDWIVRWLLDPQRLAPGTKMPSFFSDETSGPEEILEGDEERQILALRDYILSLGGARSGELR